MMRAVFYDKERETYTAVEDVIQINSTYGRYNGRTALLWEMFLDNGNTVYLPQKWYTIHRIDT